MSLSVIFPIHSDLFQKQSRAEYGFAFYADFVGFTLSHIVNFLVIWLMLDRFNNIHGWSMYEVMLLYSMNMFSYGFAATFFFFQMRDVERMVHESTFDGMLVKPINPFIHMIIRTFGYFFLGDIVVAVIMFFVCFQALNITLGFFTLIFLILMMVGLYLFMQHSLC